MKLCTSLILTLLAAGLAGCHTTPGPIFPQVSPPLLWPPAPDRPRIRYIGELRGEASLGARPQGWEALRELLAGPRPKMAFVRPTAVAVAPGGTRVFVADEGLGAVHLLDLSSRQYQLVRGTPQDPLRVPLDLTIGPAAGLVGSSNAQVSGSGSQLVVVDRGRAALDVFTLDGGWRCTRRWPEI